MSAKIVLSELREQVFSETATFDDRYVWEEIEPAEDGAYVTRRFKIKDCAHREVDREGTTCGHCGTALKAKRRT